MGPMRPSASYRLLRPEESAAVAKLATQVFDEFVAPLYSTEGIAEFHRYSDPAEFDARNRADHLTIVAESDKGIVGMLQLRAFRHVSMLFVRRDCQRCGIARELLNKAVELCQRHSPPPHTLTVKASPNAVRAYVRIGFQVMGSEFCERGIRSIPMQLTL